ncbi:MAG: UUP1 family membrane protein, partial [Pseudomonadota bacterium]
LTSGFATLSENSVSGRFGFNIGYADGGRLVRWSRRSASGEQRLYYRVVVSVDPSVEEADTTPPFPEIPVLQEPLNTAAVVLMGEVREQSADADTLVAELLQRVNDPSPGPNVELLFDGLSGSLRRTERLVELLAFARVPARPVRGLLLADEQRNASVRTYLEVHDGVSWSAYNPRTGQQG